VVRPDDARHGGTPSMDIGNSGENLKSREDTDTDSDTFFDIVLLDLSLLCHKSANA